jgi:hypothetical protein
MQEVRRTNKLSDNEKLVTEVRESLGSLVVDLGVLLGLGQLTLGKLLALVVSGGLGLAALLESLNNILVLPAVLVAETTDKAVLAAGLQAQDTQSLGNDHLLLEVVGRGDTLEDLKSLEGGGTAGGLVGNHATDGLVEDARRGAEVEGTTTGRVVSRHLAEVGGVLELSAEELSGDVEGLAADDNNLLTAQKLLGDNRGQTAKEMALAINDDDRLEGRHLFRSGMWDLWKE